MCNAGEVLTVFCVVAIATVADGRGRRYNRLCVIGSHCGQRKKGYQNQMRRFLMSIRSCQTKKSRDVNDEEVKQGLDSTWKVLVFTKEPGLGLTQQLLVTDSLIRNCAIAKIQC